MLTIKEIAVMAETSVATVSRVINNDPHVSEDTQKRVRKIIETTGYSPKRGNKSAAARHKKFLVLLPTLENPYFLTVLQGVEHNAVSKGYDPFVCITHRDYSTEKHYLNMVASGEFAGVIAFTSTLSNEELNRFASKCPFIQCGAIANGTHISFISIDDTAAAYDAVNYLVQLGNRRIGFITGLTRRTFEVHRQNGYMNVLNDNAIPFVPEYIAKCDYHYKGSYRAMESLMTLKEPPTAIFASSDLTTLGVLKYMHDHNITPGKDMDVIGFDGTYLSESSSPAFSAIEQPGYEMGRAAFDMLMEKINDINHITKKIVMAHRLIIRETTRLLPE